MANDEAQTRAVGPYLLQKTLGKGQTGKFVVSVEAFPSVRLTKQDWSSKVYTVQREKQ